MSKSILQTVFTVTYLHPHGDFIFIKLQVSGFSKSVIKSRDALIRAQIEKHHQVSKSDGSTGPTTSDESERYTLVAHEVFVGVALLVYVRDALGRRVKDVHTSWTGCGPLWMVSLSYFAAHSGSLTYY